MATAFTRPGSAPEQMSAAEVHKLHSKIDQLVLDLSRICSAPLTWYFASKEKRNGITTTNPRIP
ncbi:hypothetical protein, partial [Yoonia maritima]|uniref:hypothetical protein n=1 Tax=Yoonia maritima TaxID=1435347 RepID=UPI001A9C3E9B